MTTEIQFLQQTLDVLRVGDEAMIQSHAETIKLRIDRLKFAEAMPEILDAYQDKIDNRIKGMFSKTTGQKMADAFYREEAKGGEV